MLTEHSAPLVLLVPSTHIDSPFDPRASRRRACYDNLLPPLGLGPVTSCGIVARFERERLPAAYASYICIMARFD